MSSTNFVGKKKRNLKQYFDNNAAEVFTPNQRSMPKRQGLFKNKSKGKSFKKELNAKQTSNVKR